MKEKAMNRFVTCLLTIAILICSHTNAWAGYRATTIAAAPTHSAFALTNISLHDALQTTFASKFQHGLWRPVTAIRRADEDGNAATAPDAAWLSLIPNPPYPSYAGNMAGIGTSQATILALFFGRDDIRFDHTWAGAGGATRSYAGFGAMADEQARARVYGGIHFTFDNVAGQSVGTNVGNYVFGKLMRPRHCVK